MNQLIENKLYTDFYDAAGIIWSFFCTIIFSLFVLIKFNQKTFEIISSWLKGNHDGEVACFFCGMTRSFILISNGNINEAYSTNSYFPVLKR